VKNLKFSSRFVSAGVAFVLLLGILAGAFYFHGMGAAAHATAPYKSHPITVKPAMTRATFDGKHNLFTCQEPGALLRCYSPYQMRVAYDIQSVLKAGANGAGQTIVIIDAFQSPTIRQDLKQFNLTFGLHFSTLNIIAPDGLTPFNPNDPNQVGWAEEISLDVEWAHAIAPYATIDLVLAKSNQDADLQSVIQYAVKNNLGSVISMSFGEAEACMDPTLMAAQHQTFQNAVDKGITLFASSGDDGSAQPTCDGSSFMQAVSTPASDPLVTGVGGTYLNANTSSGIYYGEQAWNETDVVDGASGGGYSSVYSRPNYQVNFNRNKTQRGVPDIAYNASVNGGVLVYLGFLGSNSGFYLFGGTSAGSPQMAGELALVNQVFGRQGNINPTLYEGFAKHGYSQFFHDVTVGTNALVPTGIPGYSTTTGWDAVTGLGSLILGATFGLSSSSTTSSLWHH
jgi:subtilase family serine protease